MAIPKKIAHLAILVLVSISTLFGTPGLSSFVLCLGNDGHLEVEYSVNGKCGTATKAANAVALHASHGESHCGTCTDVQIIGQSEEAFRPVNGFVTPQIFALVSNPISAGIFLEHATTGMLPLPPPFKNPHLVRLRTTLLLV